MVAPLFSEGQLFSFPFIVGAEQVRIFASLSGDTNPIHLDAGFARERGFKNCVVYGSLLIAQVSKLLGMQCPGPGCVWHDLSFQFKLPLYVEEEATLAARVSYLNDDLKVVRLSLDVTRGADLIARGTAQAGWR